MTYFAAARRTRMLHRLLSAFIAFTFSFTSILPPAYAQTITSLNLPVPGVMVTPSAAFVPVLLKGMTVHPDNPLQFDFIIDSGNTNFTQDQIKDESQRLVKYFLASMTIPKDDLWVNLSPYEKDRIIPDELGKTELGRDMLAQDYILKQLTASLMYPEKELGKAFWDKVYKQAKEKYGTSEIPVDTFNKVWILPETATVYEHGQTVYIVEAKLRVMLDQDYVAGNVGASLVAPVTRQGQALPLRENNISTSIIREIILPAIEHEVNYGQNFAPLRQIYHSLILAKWYKETIKNSLLSKIYVDQRKIAGVNIDDATLKDQIYAQYMEAYKKGVFNYIKEDYDQLSAQPIPRKYFSGGITGDVAIDRTSSPIKDSKNPQYRVGVGILPESGKKNVLARMTKNTAALTLAAAITCTGAGCGDSQSRNNDKISKPTVATEIEYKTVRDNLQSLGINEFNVNKLIEKGSVVIIPLVDSVKYGPYSSESFNDYTGISAVLNGIGDPQAISLLIEEFENESIDFRGRTSSRAAPARAIIEHLNNKIFVPELIRILDHPDLYLRSSVVQALGKIADQRAHSHIIEAFQKALSEASKENKPYTEMSERSKTNLVLLENLVYALDRLNAIEMIPTFQEVILSDMWDQWSSKYSGFSNFSEIKSRFAQTYIRLKQIKGGAITNVKLLVRLLESRDPEQLLYIENLIVTGGKNAAPELIRFIDGGSRYTEGRDGRSNINSTEFAVDALLKVGDARDAVSSIFKLNSNNGIGYPFHREIGNWRKILVLNDQAVPGLLDALNNQDDRVRWLATMLLGEIKYSPENFEDIYMIFKGNFNNKAIINALVTRLEKDTEYEIRLAAWDSLRQLGIQEKRPSPNSSNTSSSPVSMNDLLNAPAGLIGALQEKGQVLSIHAGKIFDISFGDYARQLFDLGLEHPFLSITSLVVLYYYWSRYTVSGFYYLSMTNYDNWPARRNAARRIGNKLGIEILIEWLRDWHEPVRSAAAEALGKLGNARAVEPLTGKLESDSDADVRRVAANALNRLGVTKEHLVNRYLYALENTSDPNVLKIVRALGSLKDSRAVEPILALLKTQRSHYNPRIIIEALGELRDVRAVDPLIAKLSDSEVGIRIAAIEALDNIGDQRAIVPLEEHLSNVPSTLEYEENVEIGTGGAWYTRTRTEDNPEYYITKDVLERLRKNKSRNTTNIQSSSPVTGGEREASLVKSEALDVSRYVSRDTNDEVGGIDMNAIDLERLPAGGQGEGGGVDIQFDPADLQDIIDAGIDGFAPVIINITPLPSVLPLLGLEPAAKEEKLEVSRLD